MLRRSSTGYRCSHFQIGGAHYFYQIGRQINAACVEIQQYEWYDMYERTTD